METVELKKIISTCNRILKKDLPQSVKDGIDNVIVSCESESLRNELTSLGYEYIEQYTPVNVSDNNYYVCQNRYDNIEIVHWLSGNRVAWPDDQHKKPVEGKFYVEISFPTGPYCICGHDGFYEKARPFFDDMWKRIISYNPDSSDSHNSTVYFEIHRKDTVELWNNIGDIIEEARKSYVDYITNDREEKIKRLEDELRKLKNQQIYHN